MTTSLVASVDEALAKRLARQVSTPTFAVRHATDPLGRGALGAFKNVIALACGPLRMGSRDQGA